MSVDGRYTASGRNWRLSLSLVAIVFVVLSQGGLSKQGLRQVQESRDPHTLCFECRVNVELLGAPFCKALLQSAVRMQSLLWDAISFS